MLILSFLVIVIVGCIFPIIYVTIRDDIPSFPGYHSSGMNGMFSQPYFRIAPFIIGIGIAIIKFEYKYVGTINDGIEPIHKVFFDKWKNRLVSKILAYTIGSILVALPLLVLYDETNCVNKDPIYTLQFKPLQYCWNTVECAMYNSLAQFCFFTGIIIILLPATIGTSKYLVGILDSHIWHILEELSLSAYLI